MQINFVAIFVGVLSQFWSDDILNNKNMCLWVCVCHVYCSDTDLNILVPPASAVALI